jgi:hypothetical protein
VAKVVEAEPGADHRPRVGRARLDAMKEFQLSLRPAADNPRPACWRRAAVCPLDDPMGTPSRPVAKWGVFCFQRSINSASNGSSGTGPLEALLFGRPT